MELRSALTAPSVRAKANLLQYEWNPPKSWILKLLKHFGVDA